MRGPIATRGSLRTSFVRCAVFFVAAAAAHADSTTLEGQVVCSRCWFEADRG